MYRLGPTSSTFAPPGKPDILAFDLLLLYSLTKISSYKRPLPSTKSSCHLDSFPTFVISQSWKSKSLSESSDFLGNIWIGDNGSLCHWYNSDEGLFDTNAISEKVTVGNGKTMEAIKIGSLKSDVVQKDGASFQIMIEVKLFSDLWINVFTINKVLKNGF